MQHTGSLGHGFGPQHTDPKNKRTLSLVAMRHTTQAAQRQTGVHKVLKGIRPSFGPDLGFSGQRIGSEIFLDVKPTRGCQQ